MRKGWETRRLGEAVAQISTGPFGSMLHKSDYQDVGFPLVNPTNIQGERVVPDPETLLGEATRERLRSYILQEGDLVMGRRGELGRCAVVGSIEAGWVCGTGCFFIRPTAALNTRFLAHIIRSEPFRVMLDQVATGSTMKNLSNSALADLPIPFPPLPEQHRIVALLDEAFAGIAKARENTERNLENAREVFQSHLESVFRDAFASGQLASLSDIASDITDGDHMPPPKAESGVPFITIGNVRKETRTIDFEKSFHVPSKYYEALKFNRRPQRGDVLFTVTGSFGIPVLVDVDIPFCFQRHIALVRPVSGIDSRWLTYTLLSPQVFRQADAGATGTAQRTVSLKTLRCLKVPSMPLTQQRTLASRMGAIEAETQHLTALYQRKLAALDALKQSLLHRAFHGDL